MSESLTTTFSPAMTRQGVSTSRKVYNPVQKDYAIFLETSAATNGERTLIEIELAPGGGNAAHYHQAFSERFEVLEGELHVQVGQEERILRPTQAETVPINTLHRFFNPTDQAVRFLVELRPGNTGFEQALQIAYGLAADGKTNAQSIPTNLYHMALLFTFSESHLAGFMALLTPLFRLLAARARRLGIERELIERYCQ